MTHLDKLIRHVTWRLFITLTLSNLLMVGIFSLLHTALSHSLAAILAVIFGTLIAFGLALFNANSLNEPLRVLWQAILHVSAEQTSLPAPNLETVKLGRELVAGLAMQVYQLASRHSNPPKTGDPKARVENFAENVPLPLIVADKNEIILFANKAALEYLKLPAVEVIGKGMYPLLDLSFPSEETLEAWVINSRQNKALATRSWERVRLKLPEQNNFLQFDLAASYSKDNPGGFETILVLFDHTNRYGQDDQAASYVALAVHELRTPLTTLRGYIEVFEDELGSQLNPEMTDFMHKMKVSSQQLSTFVNNILNVARIDENQMVLQLSEAPWDQVLSAALEDMKLRAQVHDKTIEAVIPPGLPTVAIDRVSIYEVISNLVDNAIKYSGPGPKKIIVSTALKSDGLIETTVQDSGVGVTESAMPHLFDKFYRNHRTRTQIGGTGLGLYLSKAIVSAHGGNIWVRSKEGEGSTFGFTLQPYATLAQEVKDNNNKEIARGSHGWIKNHSLLRK